MGERIRAFDWSSTALGPPESWSPALHTLLPILLASRFPQLLWWGPEYIQLYNDPYRPIPGAKHPDRSFGCPARECWAEIWHIIGPLVDRPFHGGPATWDDDIMLEIDRHGYLEESHFTIAYSPVPDRTAPNGVGGVLATVHEITEKVVGERRVTALRDLSTRTSEARTAEEACALAAETLAGHDRDVPFMLLYLVDRDGGRARCVGASGVGPGGEIGPAEIDLATWQGGWPIREALRSGTAHVVEGLGERFNRVPRGPWSDPPHTAVVLPIPSSIGRESVGFALAGVSVRSRLDGRYRDFFELVRMQIASAVAKARAYDEERKRAEALAELDRAKTAFFSNVSHEFRTPLTLILGPVEDALAEAGTQGPERERLELLHRSALRLQKLVNTLLDFSRIEAGRIQASYEPVDLAALTRELASVFRSAIETAGLRLTVDCPTLSEAVYVDHEMYEKIVLNLLSNAFKFTLEGEIEVVLQETGDAVRLAVRDTGEGIAAEHLPHIFERFHRVEGVRARTHEGTGIGLALVQELARLHGGTIAVESEDGVGSTFTVTIRKGKAHLPPDRIGATKSLGSTALVAERYVEEALRWLPDAEGRKGAPHAIARRLPPRTGEPRRPRIVLADDNVDMREYVSHLLGSLYDVEALPDGRAALEAIRRRRPDLVLADVMMPHLDGFGLLHALREAPELRAIPVVMLSARAGEEARLEGVQAGADDYLTKPFNARELLARVGAQIDMARTRRESEAQLRESEARFRTLADDAPVMIWVTEPDGRCAFLSRSWHEFTGQTPESGMGYGWMNAIHPDDRARVQGVWQAASARREPFRLEYRIRRRDDVYRWAIDTAAPRFGHPGEFLGFIGSMMDITDRKEAEESVQRSDERFRRAVEAAGALVYDVDLFDDSNAEAYGIEHIIGAEGRGAVLSSPWWHARIHPDDLTGHLDHLRKRLDDPDCSSYRAGYRVRHTDGSWRDVEDTARIVRDRAGRAQRLVGTILDVTERKLAEASVRHQAERFETLLNRAPLGVYLVDADLRIREVNPVALPYFGEIPGGVIGRDFGEVARHMWTRKHADEILRIFRHTLATGEPYMVAESTAFRIDRGVIEHYEWRLDRIVLPEGRAGVVCYLRDISQEVQSRLAIAKATLALREADRRKDEFLAVLAHELRNPLGPVRSAAHYLKSRGLSDPDLQRPVEMIERQVAHMARLLDDLLDVSRISRGVLELRPESLDFREIAEAVVEACRDEVEARGHTLTTTLPEGEMPIQADRHRLIQVFGNLIVNAAKYTPRGGTIDFRARRDGDRLEMRVQDNGVGIPPQKLSEIFELFAQVDRSLERQGGLGIGLTLAREFVELHQGAIQALSDGPGCGTTIVVRLPIAMTAEISSPEGASAAPSPAETTRRILVADDNPDAVEGLTLLLEASGHVVRGAHDGEAALRLAAEFLPDVALIDIGMPKMNGYEVARKIRASDWGRGIRLIAVTGWGQESDRQQADEAGFDAHLVKPASPDVLSRLVAEVGRRPDSDALLSQES